jgi:hypothetical protein
MDYESPEVVATYVEDEIAGRLRSIGGPTRTDPTV